MFGHDDHQFTPPQDNQPASAPLPDNNIPASGVSSLDDLTLPTVNDTNASSPLADDPFAPQSAPQPVNAAASPTNDDLMTLKQQALQQLTPLVGHLEQTPEEKFRTTMMMIQAADDQSLLQTAYDAAQNIEDKKARAQALLDVVNEINYFTQHGNPPNISK
jgi:hypothetical protein